MFALFSRKEVRCLFGGDSLRLISCCFLSCCSLSLSPLIRPLIPFLDVLCQITRASVCVHCIVAARLTDKRSQERENRHTGRQADRGDPRLRVSDCVEEREKQKARCQDDKSSFSHSLHPLAAARGSPPDSHSRRSHVTTNDLATPAEDSRASASERTVIR